MRTAGIIAEYNPFHNGHAYHIAQTRKQGATHIVAVMSGNVVQRGETAVMDKHQRAQRAVAHGVDLVLELPCPFACASAEKFALGAVTLLNGLGKGVVEMLSFGAESADIATLENAARVSMALGNSEVVKNLMAAGNTYPAALAKAAAMEYSEKLAAVFLSPNNTLAVEYIKALEATDSYMVPYAVERHGAAHDSEQAQGRIASAAQIRKLLAQGYGAEEYLPYRLSTAEENISTYPVMERAALYRLAAMRRENFDCVPDCTKELADRIYDAVQRDFAASLDELAERVKAKNFTMARIRRVLLYCVLGIRHSDFETVPYGRILAFNHRGREVLAAAKRAGATLPLSPSLKELSQTSPQAERAAELDVLSSRLQQLGCAEIVPVNEYTKQVKITL